MHASLTFSAADKDMAEQVAEILRRGKRLLICTHMGPDGDAIGSSAALGYIAQSLGLELRLFCQSELPAHLSWLPLPAPLLHSLADLRGWRPDVLALVDCGNAARAGKEIENLFLGHKLAGLDKSKLATFNIDHHLDNPKFAQVNWVDAEAPAAAEVVARLARYLGLPLAGPLGQAIYLGLATDTGNFTYASTNADSLRLAADILDQGLKVEDLFNSYDNSWSLGRMQLWGELMQNLRLCAGGRVVSTLIRLDTLKKHHCDSADLDGFVSFLRHIKGAEVSLLLRERVTGGTKISLRSMGGENSLNVQAVAAKFGGGGHKSAAGAETRLPIDQAEAEVLKELEAAVAAADPGRPAI